MLNILYKQDFETSVRVLCGETLTRREIVYLNDVKNKICLKRKNPSKDEPQQDFFRSNSTIRIAYKNSLSIAKIFTPCGFFTSHSERGLCVHLYLYITIINFNVK